MDEVAPHKRYTISFDGDQLTAVLDCLLHRAQEIRGGGIPLQTYQMIVNTMLQQTGMELKQRFTEAQ